MTAIGPIGDRQLSARQQWKADKWPNRRRRQLARTKLMLVGPEGRVDSGHSGNEIGRFPKKRKSRAERRKFSSLCQFQSIIDISCNRSCADLSTLDRGKTTIACPISIGGIRPPFDGTRTSAASTKSASDQQGIGKMPLLWVGQ